jgi:hypothetical protein
VIPENGDNRYANRRERLGHELGFLGLPAVREVPAEGKHIGVFGNLPEQDLEGSIESFAAEMDISDGCNPYNT